MHNKRLRALILPFLIPRGAPPPRADTLARWCSRVSRTGRHRGPSSRAQTRSHGGARVYPGQDVTAGPLPARQHPRTVVLACIQDKTSPRPSSRAPTPAHGGARVYPGQDVTLDSHPHVRHGYAHRTELQGRRMRIPRLFLSDVLLLIAIGLLLPTTAAAQTGAGSLTGLVSDQSGAKVPGATVTAVNQATNVAYTAVSNEAGNYSVTSVPVGMYVVKAELAGFKTATTTPIQVEAKAVVRMDFDLQLGAIEETILVAGQSPLMQTETATVGQVISGTTVVGLPLNGRNTGQLSLLLPGVVSVNPGSFTAVRNFGAGRPFANGNREQTNNYLIDGVDMNESIDNLVAYQPSPDALAEISVETNNYAADTGNVAGAVISNVIKSGSNVVRGNVFEFYRNSDFDANTWDNNRSNAPKAARRQHIFGGTLGGPLKKDKWFVFADYQGTRFHAPGSETVSVAPDEWRRGDLSGVSSVVRDPVTGQVFAGNQIPAARISPIARAILGNTALYPSPNRSVGSVSGNYVGDALTTTRAHQGDLRVDWNAT